MLSPRLAQLRVKHLTLLDIVADNGSLRQAAKILCVTQPAVTSMLKEMESLLQIVLVERSQQGAKLTAEGEIVRDRLRLVLNALHGLEASITAPTVQQHLRIGALSLAMLEMMPGIISQLRERRPDLTFEFYEGTVDEIIEGVIHGRLDCAIGRMSNRFDQKQYGELFIRPVAAMPLKAVCSIHNPIAGKKSLTLKQLRDQNWILLPKGTASRNAFESAFMLKGLLPPAPVIESLSWLSNFHLAASSELLTVATAIAVDRYAAYGLIAPVNISWPAKLLPLVFFCRKEVENLQPVKAFHEALNEMLGLTFPQRFSQESEGSSL